MSQLSSVIGTLYFQDALQYAKDLGGILSGVMTIGEPVFGLLGGSPNITRSAVPSAMYRRYQQEQPGPTYTPCQYIKISGDYIYVQSI